MDTLTQKQEEIYNVIKDSILSKGYPPSVREIGELVGLKSTSSVHAHLNTLEKKGFIRKDPTKPRTIEITDDTFNLTRREVVNVPMVGTVAAGMPILATENITDYFPIPSEFLPNTDIFMLRVKGESMINVGIHDGDQIIVSKQNTAKNGDIIVALVEDSATVKTFYKEKNFYRLQPENDSMEPILVKEVTILGKLCGIVEFYEKKGPLRMAQPLKILSSDYLEPASLTLAALPTLSRR